VLINGVSAKPMDDCSVFRSSSDGTLRGPGV
jgi:hypothetical protein